jgi:hypothetical protein
MGKFDQFWEMNEGSKAVGTNEVFKCTDCGGTTHHADGHNGEPDLDQCADHCSSRDPSADWKPGGVSRKYTKNYDAIKFAGANKKLVKAVVQQGARVVTRFCPKGA